MLGPGWVPVGAGMSLPHSWEGWEPSYRATSESPGRLKFVVLSLGTRMGYDPLSPCEGKHSPGPHLGGAGAEF